MSDPTDLRGYARRKSYEYCDARWDAFCAVEKKLLREFAGTGVFEDKKLGLAKYAEEINWKKLKQLTNENCGDMGCGNCWEAMRIQIQKEVLPLIWRDVDSITARFVEEIGEEFMVVCTPVIKEAMA